MGGWVNTPSSPSPHPLQTYSSSSKTPSRPIFIHCFLLPVTTRRGLLPATRTESRQNTPMCTGQLQLYRNFYRSTKQGRTDNSWLNTPPEDNTRKMLSRVEGAAGVHSPRDSLTCCSPSSVILSKKYSLYWYHNNNGKCKPAKKDNKEKKQGIHYDCKTLWKEICGQNTE